MASILDGGLGYMSGTGIAADGASALPTAARAPGSANADDARTGMSSRIEATTPFADGGWTAQ